MPFVQITWLEGRSVDQKRKIAKRIASALMEEGKASAEHIQITFQDLPATSYALVADLKPEH
jgi:phenylpyruvate tautomerase PptA (4-oxalocrotonate tautomerase family)